MSLTLDDLIAKSGVKNIDRECTGDDILAFGDFCDPWRQVGLHLRLDSAELNAIDEDNRTVSLKRLGTLQKWKSKFSFKATYKVLINALLKCGKADQALKVCQILAQKEDESIPEVDPIPLAQTAVQQATSPTKAASKLDLVIDAENRSSKHLGQIADSMYEWQGAIADELGLSPADVAAIKTKYPTRLDLQAREALQKWKQANGSAATYRNLIGVFETAGYQGFAGTVRNIFSPGPKFNAPEGARGVAHVRSSTSPAEPVQLVKPVTNNGSYNVLREPVRHSPKAASMFDHTPGVRIIEPEQAAEPQSFPGTVRSNHLKLIKWTEGGETKRFYLMEKIENKWRDIGQLAGLSLSQLESIATEHRDKPIECCRAVLGRWLDNPPHEYPITWDGLIELLEDCELTSAVKELKTVLSKANLS